MFVTGLYVWRQKEPTRALPDLPKLARSFRLDIQSLVDSIKLSSETRQAAEAAGKIPHLFPGANTFVPSARSVKVR